MTLLIPHIPEPFLPGGVTWFDFLFENSEKSTPRAKSSINEGRATATPVLTAGTSEVILSGYGTGSVAYVGTREVVVVVVVVVVLLVVVVVVGDVGKKSKGGIFGGATGFDEL